MRKQNRVYKRICSKCEEEIIFKSNKKPKKCPNCNTKYYDKPDLERKLFVLQDQFLKKRNPEILGEMYPLLKVYIKKIITKKIKGKLVLTKSDIELKAHDTTTKIIQYYLEKPDFKIEASFGGYAKFPVLWVLWGNKKEEDHDSLDFEIEENKEFYSNVDNIGYTTLGNHTDDVEEQVIIHNKDIVYENVLKLLKDIFNTICNMQSYFLAFISFQGFLLSLHSQESFMNEYKDFFGNKVKKNIENIRLLLLEYLHKNLMG